MTITLLWELWATGPSLSGTLLEKQARPPGQQRSSKQQRSSIRA